MNISPLLFYHGLLVIIVGIILLLFPHHIQPQCAFMDNKQLLFYRICGIWVIFGGVVSLYIWRYADKILKRNACFVFFILHFTELCVKMLSKLSGDSYLNMIGNGHFVILFFLAFLCV